MVSGCIIESEVVLKIKQKYNFKKISKKKQALIKEVKLE